MGKHTINKSVSFEKDLFQMAKARSEAEGFKHSFSAWITKLVSNDLNDEREEEKQRRKKVKA